MLIRLILVMLIALYSGLSHGEEDAGFLTPETVPGIYDLDDQDIEDEEFTEEIVETVSVEEETFGLMSIIKTLFYLALALAFLGASFNCVATGDYTALLVIFVLSIIMIPGLSVMENVLEEMSEIRP